MTCKKGDWVRIHSVILPAAERTGNLPEDTKATDIQMWTKGFLINETAQIGDEVEVETMVGRRQTGRLEEVNPYYKHDYGKALPEILYIGRQLRDDLARLKEEK